jgi:glutamate-1-semialdehyde 2,1-aminomutase
MAAADRPGGRAEMTELSSTALASLADMKRSYVERHPASAQLYVRASHVLAGGTSHNYRTSSPIPLYWKRGQGSRMWDVDGLEYVDYALNGASALLGHGNPQLLQAITSYDPHLGGATNSELEVIWGERIKAHFPSADLVRFTGSGSDSTTLAFRLVRAFTGRTKIMRFGRAYHGWHDHSAIGYIENAPVPRGIPESQSDLIVTANLDGDLNSVAARLAQGDIAGMIVEPSGAGMGMNLLPPDKLKAVRVLALEAGVPFICDENITGFRWSPGGIQGLLQLDPDLTLLGKIATGGFPGSAVAGKAAIMEQLGQGVRSTVSHSGTYNGHPAVAIAAIAMIDAISDGEPQRRAAAYASDLKRELNQVLADLSIAGFAYGPSSTYWVYLHPKEALPLAITPGRPDYELVSPSILSSAPLEMVEALYCGLCNNGVLNTIFNGGFTSAVHGQADLEKTANAYRAVLLELRERGIVATV